MFNKTIPRGGAGMGRGGSKKCKPIPAPPRGAGLKSHPIPAPPPLRGRENPYGAKRGGAGQAGRGKIAIPIINPVIVKESSSKEYIQIVPIDGYDFWFMGFVYYQKVV